MFNRLPDATARTVEIFFEGRALDARETDCVSAALIASGVFTCRATPVSEAARGPYCMMGVCFDCLVTIDGVPNQQGCMIRVRAGMKVERQQGARNIIA